MSERFYKKGARWLAQQGVVWLAGWLSGLLERRPNGGTNAKGFETQTFGPI